MMSTSELEFVPESASLPLITTDLPMNSLLNAKVIPVDIMDWKDGSNSDFDISFKYPSTWKVVTSSDTKGVPFFTITDSLQGGNSNNQIIIGFTSYQNCNGNGDNQPEFKGLKVSDSKWNDYKTFISRSLCFPYKQFYIKMTAISAEAKSIEEQILTTINFTKYDITGWKNFTDSSLGISFDYPAYLGHVIVEKANSQSCPEMKTYARNGQLLSHDYIIWFSERQRVGSGGSYMIYNIPVIKTENNTEICGTDLLTLRENMPSDPRYQSSVFVQPNASNAYISTVDTTIGTSANQFYTLYFIERNKLTVMQPNITFIPYAYSAEGNEIMQKENLKNQISSIVDFVLHSDNAKMIRDYFADFKILVESIKVTN